VERKSGTDIKKYKIEIPTRIKKSEKINILNQYSKELEKIKPGRKEANKYHKIIFNILIEIFDERLKTPRMEEYLAKKTQRCDITFRNEREKGFFKQLAEGYHKICPSIFLECKNYNEDIGNPEFAQIQNRLNKSRGQFGIIICRKIIDITKVEKRQENLIRDDKYILVFDDSDIKKLILWKLDEEEEKIDDYLEERFKELI